ncbi:MAG: M20/M25/M40 family metallo-hydrolase [Chitinophagales bacterium]|nr:M20/M25/M40 family metallo-hydrolase [Chitinophagales bacterium]
MKKIFLPFTIFFLLGMKNITAGPADSLLIKNLRKHVYYLASDKLKGRNTGSQGEKKAYKYIIKQYKSIGIIPKGEDGFLQPFTFTYGRKLNGKNELVINGVHLKLNEDYYPLNVSSNKTVKAKITDVGFGIIAQELVYDSYKNFSPILKGNIYLMETSTPDGDNPHSPYAAYADIHTKIENAKSKGASAVIFTNSLPNADDLEANLDINTPSADIPVIFVKHDALKQVLRNEFNSAEIITHLEKVTLTGHNIVSFIDNGAPSTVVIGAHFDHLGYGDFSNSLYRGEPAIHNGADDNASGTAAVIEIARHLGNNTIREKNNYLFINFSGEELGLIGSKYWVEHATYDTSKINYMVNMDMIGRYDPEKGIEISGIGTSPADFEFISTLSYEDLKFKISDNGTGPTDHTSFYYANIPVLNFFTGTHEDYHKPSDDADKINFTKEATIVQLIDSIIMVLDAKGTFPFSKTKESDGGDIPQFKVRLGIIPDYLYDGVGLRVDGVDEGKPGFLAGIKKGDVILSIGEFQVSDIMTYMKALSGFNKGDNATVIVKRGDMNSELHVIF